MFIYEQLLKLAFGMGVVDNNFKSYCTSSLYILYTGVHRAAVLQ